MTIKINDDKLGEFCRFAEMLNWIIKTVSLCKIFGLLFEYRNSINISCISCDAELNQCRSFLVINLTLGKRIYRKLAECHVYYSRGRNRGCNHGQTHYHYQIILEEQILLNSVCQVDFNDFDEICRMLVLDDEELI